MGNQGAKTNEQVEKCNKRSIKKEMRSYKVLVMGPNQSLNLKIYDQMKSKQGRERHQKIIKMRMNPPTLKVRNQSKKL